MNPAVHSGAENIRSNSEVPVQQRGEAPNGLRGFLRLLSDLGRLERVTEPIHWKYEIGRRTRESRSALLFENIVDYPGQRVFTNGMRDLSPLALALGMDPEISREDLNAELKQRIATPIAPRIVAAGPATQSTGTPEDVDLLRLPVPHWNEQDCARYLGTWHINVTKDPQTGVRNVGVYRMQLLGRNQATISTSSGSHLGQHLALAEQEGQALEMAVAIGVEEPVILAAAAGCPYGSDEYDLAGALRQRPLELIRGKEVDLEVPAESEIVIEGIIQPHVRVQDGPYFDYTGTVNTNPNAFLFEARRISCRDNPVFRGTSIGLPGAEDHQLLAVLADLHLLDFHFVTTKSKVQDLILKTRLQRWIAEGSRSSVE